MMQNRSRFGIIATLITLSACAGDGRDPYGVDYNGLRTNARLPISGSTPISISQIPPSIVIQAAENGDLSTSIATELGRAMADSQFYKSKYLTARSQAIAGDSINNISLTTAGAAYLVHASWPVIAIPIGVATVAWRTDRDILLTETKQNSYLVSDAALSCVTGITAQMGSVQEYYPIASPPTEQESKDRWKYNLNDSVFKFQTASPDSKSLPGSRIFSVEGLAKAWKEENSAEKKKEYSDLIMELAQLPEVISALRGDIALAIMSDLRINYSAPSEAYCRMFSEFNKTVAGLSSRTLPLTSCDMTPAPKAADGDAAKTAKAATDPAKAEQDPAAAPQVHVTIAQKVQACVKDRVATYYREPTKLLDVLNPGSKGKP